MLEYETEFFLPYKGIEIKVGYSHVGYFMHFVYFAHWFSDWLKGIWRACPYVYLISCPRIMQNYEKYKNWEITLLLLLLILCFVIYKHIDNCHDYSVISLNLDKKKGTLRRWSTNCIIKQKFHYFFLFDHFTI